MLASQLLGVFQTMPSEMKHGTCVSDGEEQNMNTKENQNSTFYDSKNFRQEADPLAFEGKGIRQVNGSRRADDPIAFGVNGGGKHWNINTVDDLSYNCEHGRLDSPRKSSAAKDKEKLRSSPILELSNVDKESESSDLGSPQVTTSDLLEKDTNFCTDKNVLECESPELTVCDKEINFHAVKDICIDEGMPTKDKIFIESCKEDQPGTERDINNVCVISNGLEPASIRSIGETECENTGVSYDELLAQCRSKAPSGNLSADDSAKHCEMENSMQVGETNCVGIDNSKRESYVDSKLPIEEFGVRSFLRCFLESLDDEGNKTAEQHEELQIFSGEEGSKIPESSVEVESDARTKEDIKPNTLLHDSKFEGGSITFDFDSPEQLVSNITKKQTENLKAECIESGKVHAHRDGTADSISDSSLAQCDSIRDNTSEDAQEQPEQAADVKNEDSDRSSEATPVQHVNSKDVEKEMTHDGQGIEQHSVKHGRKNSDEVSVARQLRHDEGESSFTAAGLITFSGPIAYSGSLSLRSDGSAASGRSFAFPILQSEWNSSPVRMAKADRRHFRKHKGWRSGLLCCRF